MADGKTADDTAREMRDDAAARLMRAMADAGGPAAWVAGLPAGALAPVNGASGNGYKSVNRALLTLAAAQAGYADPRWCTRKQAERHGWKVKPGESPQTIASWKSYRVPVDADGHALGDASDAAFVRFDERQRADSSYEVYNFEQIDGAPDLVPPQPADGAAYEALRASSRCPVVDDPDGLTYYDPAADVIHVPAPASYPSERAAVAGLAREIARSAEGGGSPAVPAGADADPGSRRHAESALRAELGGAMVMSAAGLERPAAMSYDGSERTAVGQIAAAADADPVATGRALLSAFMDAGTAADAAAERIEARRRGRSDGQLAVPSPARGDGRAGAMAEAALALAGAAAAAPFAEASGRGDGARAAVPPRRTAAQAPAPAYDAPDEDVPQEVLDAAADAWAAGAGEEEPVRIAEPVPATAPARQEDPGRAAAQEGTRRGEAPAAQSARDGSPGQGAEKAGPAETAASAFERAGREAAPDLHDEPLRWFEVHKGEIDRAVKVVTDRGFACDVAGERLEFELGAQRDGMGFYQCAYLPAMKECTVAAPGGDLSQAWVFGNEDNWRPRAADWYTGGRARFAEEHPDLAREAVAREAPERSGAPRPDGKGAPAAEQAPGGPAEEAPAQDAPVPPAQAQPEQDADGRTARPGPAINSAPERWIVDHGAELEAAPKRMAAGAVEVEASGTKLRYDFQFSHGNVAFYSCARHLEELTGQMPVEGAYDRLMIAVPDGDAVRAAGPSPKVAAAYGQARLASVEANSPIHNMRKFAAQAQKSYEDIMTGLGIVVTGGPDVPAPRAAKRPGRIRDCTKSNAFQRNPAKWMHERSPELQEAAQAAQASDDGQRMDVVCDGLRIGYKRAMETDAAWWYTCAAEVPYLDESCVIAVPKEGPSARPIGPDEETYQSFIRVKETRQLLDHARKAGLPDDYIDRQTEVLRDCQARADGLVREVRDARTEALEEAARAAKELRDAERQRAAEARRTADPAAKSPQSAAKAAAAPAATAPQAAQEARPAQAPKAGIPDADQPDGAGAPSAGAR